MLEGDELERQAVDFWRQMAQQNCGWLWKLLRKLKKLSCFDKICNDDSVFFNSNSKELNTMLKEINKLIILNEEIRCKAQIEKSKHAWMLPVWPKWNSLRPWEVKDLPEKHVLTLTRWAGCEHNCLIEMGIIFRVPRCERLCKRCKVIDDEFHALGNCIKHFAKRLLAVDKLKLVFDEAEVTVATNSSEDEFFSLLTHIHLLKQQKTAWIAVAIFMKQIEEFNDQKELIQPKRRLRKIPYIPNELASHPQRCLQSSNRHTSHQAAIKNCHAIHLTAIQAATQTHEAAMHQAKLPCIVTKLPSTPSGLLSNPRNSHPIHQARQAAVQSYHATIKTHEVTMHHAKLPSISTKLPSTPSTLPYKLPSCHPIQ